uniref:Uncharacterized protein n=1 Tax=Heterorhabditis bacteriophora TaxID=37862 RepID=A0A1I7X401_HETBA
MGVVEWEAWDDTRVVRFCVWTNQIRATTSALDESHVSLRPAHIDLITSHSLL